MGLNIQEQKTVQVTDVESSHQLEGSGDCVLAFNLSDRWSLIVNGLTYSARQTAHLTLPPGGEIKLQFMAGGSGEVKLTRGVRT